MILDSMNRWQKIENHKNLALVKLWNLILPPPLPITLIFCLQVYNFKVRNIFLRFWIACKVFFKKSQKNIINFNLCSRFTFVLVIVTKIFVFKSLKRLCSYMFICVHIYYIYNAVITVWETSHPEITVYFCTFSE